MKTLFAVKRIKYVDSVTDFVKQENPRRELKNGGSTQVIHIERHIETIVFAELSCGHDRRIWPDMWKKTASKKLGCRICDAEALASEMPQAPD